MPEKNPARWTIRRVLKLIGALLLLFVCSITSVAAFLPVPEDAVIPLAQQGGGARQGDTATTGLQLEWEALPSVDAAQAELGRLLFYDPVLSANNDIACATCHHPDQGFSDGRTVALGSHGDLRRNSPSLWNVAYNDAFFWDGRAASLEEQMLIPLTHADEMGANLDDIVVELASIPAYKERFTEVFTDSITLDNVVAAIVAFERTLITNNTPFDRFAAGDFNALTPAQRRGFEIFRSAETRCFECHAWPTFTHNTFHVLGVPDLDPDHPDLGQIEVLNAADAERGFKAPGLRNIALSAPYMHNGVFPTLEEVIQFYSDGGGREDGIENVDEKLRGFDLTDQEVADLVAFLQALTDEPADFIAIPASVPSGLAVVQPMENAAREQVEIANADPFVPGERNPQTITVEAGESIQRAVDQALPGDVILVEPGIYYESVYIDTPNITVRGIIADETERAWTEGTYTRPWLDGENTRSDGFNTTGDNFILEGFGMRGYIGNAVLTTGAQNVVFRDLIIYGTYSGDVQTIYGLYPVECTGVLIENTIVTGIADAAIYVGQSRGPIIVRDNEVYGNVTGIEIENSTHAEVYHNYAHDNTGGILVFLLPNNPSKVGYGTRVYENVIDNNNHENFGAEGSTVSMVPPGTGIMIMTADNTEVFNNEITNNQTAGVALTSLYILYDKDTVFDLGPLPENNYIHDNTWSNNGYAPKGMAEQLGIPGADIVWTGEGWNNAFDEPNASKIPPILPGRNWSAPGKRLIWRIYDTIFGLLL
jgi:cytochrome c peroxidase